MNLETVRELAFKHLGERKAHQNREKGFIYYHGQRTAKIAVKLREILLPDDNSRDEIITAACYFHDIAKGIEPHGQYGSVLVKELLKGHCEDREIEDIAELIRCHQLRKSGEQFSDTVKIVQDADILDHYGTIEIWMNFLYYAHEDAPMQESVKFYKEQFEDHVKHMTKLLNYEISQQIFRDKIQFQREFIERFAVEAQGDIYDKDSIQRLADGKEYQ
jgi:uncharacterized protein